MGQTLRLAVEGGYKRYLGIMPGMGEFLPFQASQSSTRNDVSSIESESTEFWKLSWDSEWGGMVMGRLAMNIGRSAILWLTPIYCCQTF